MTGTVSKGKGQERGESGENQARRLTSSVHGQIQTLNLAIPAKDLAKMRARNILSELLHHNL